MSSLVEITDRSAAGFLPPRYVPLMLKLELLRRPDRLRIVMVPPDRLKEAFIRRIA